MNPSHSPVAADRNRDGLPQFAGARGQADGLSYPILNCPSADGAWWSSARTAVGNLPIPNTGNARCRRPAASAILSAEGTIASGMGFAISLLVNVLSAPRFCRSDARRSPSSGLQFSCTVFSDSALIEHFLDSERIPGVIGGLEMSIHQATVEDPSIYRVVGRRATGERVVITHNADPAIAEQIMSLMWGTGDYSDL